MDGVGRSPSGESAAMPDAGADINAVLHALRVAHDDAEQRVAKELEKVMGSQSSMRREIDDARAKNIELQKEVDRLTTQKNYVSDAFENSRKETAKLRAENQANAEDIARLRRMVEELQQGAVADQVGRRTVLAEVGELEVERDVLSRALGTATKQLFGKQMAAAAESSGLPAAATGGKQRSATPVKRIKPTAKALAGTPGQSPRQTGGSGRKSSVGSTSGGRLPW